MIKKSKIVKFQIHKNIMINKKKIKQFNKQFNIKYNNGIVRVMKQVRLISVLLQILGTKINNKMSKKKQ